MVKHIAHLTGTTVEEVCEEFAGDYSILVPILTGVTRPPTVSPPHVESSMLQYPLETEDDKDEGQWTLRHSLPPLMIPPCTEEVECLVTPLPPVSPLLPYTDFPFEGTDVPSPPGSPILCSVESTPTTDWSKGLKANKENWAPQPLVHPGPGYCRSATSNVDSRIFLTCPIISSPFPTEKGVKNLLLSSVIALRTPAPSLKPAWASIVTFSLAYSMLAWTKSTTHPSLPIKNGSSNQIKNIPWL
jgi:hypothetical protein